MLKLLGDREKGLPVLMPLLKSNQDRMEQLCLIIRSQTAQNYSICLGILSVHLLDE